MLCTKVPDAARPNAAKNKYMLKKKKKKKRREIERETSGRNRTSLALWNPNRKDCLPMKSVLRPIVSPDKWHMEEREMVSGHSLVPSVTRAFLSFYQGEESNWYHWSASREGACSPEASISQAKMMRVNDCWSVRDRILPWKSPVKLL